MSKRTHIVYTAWDSAGRPLYVGCTGKPDARYRAHRATSPWFRYATRFTMSGPYPENVALRLERERIVALEPHFNWLPQHSADVAARKAWAKTRYTSEAALDRRFGFHTSAIGRHKLYVRLINRTRLAVAA